MKVTAITTAINFQGMKVVAIPTAIKNDNNEIAAILTAIISAMSVQCIDNEKICSICCDYKVLKNLLRSLQLEKLLDERNTIAATLLML